MSQASLSVDELLSALQRKGIPLPFEIGTFLVLQAAEQALVLEATVQGMAAPPQVAMSDVWLSDDGEISVEPSHGARNEKESCRSLVEMLGDLLVRSAPGVPPMLLELVERGPSDGEWTLLRLRDDLEASLVPLNRGALRRVLARLLREVRRDIDRGPAASPPDARSVDRDLDALLGVESSDEAPSDSGAPPPARVDRDDEGADEAQAAYAGVDEEAPTQRRSRSESAELAPRGRGSRRAAWAVDASMESESADVSLRPERRPKSRGRGPFERAAADLEQFDAEGTARGGRGARIGLVLLMVSAALVAAYLMFGRDRARTALGIEPAEGAAKNASGQIDPPKPAVRYGELRVTSTPARAQVLLFVGIGPAVVPDLPAGVAHEFVAIADGKAASRAVVPADAPWQLEGGRRRYEIALQLDDADPRRRAMELGTTRLPSHVGTPSGALGDVRAVTSPPGARVYQLVGFTPDVSISNLRIDEPLELLVYLGGHQLRRIAIQPSDWKAIDGKLVASLDVQLARL